MGDELFNIIEQVDKAKLDASWNKAIEKSIEIVMESDLISVQIKRNLVDKFKSHLK